MEYLPFDPRKISETGSKQAIEYINEKLNDVYLRCMQNGIYRFTETDVPTEGSYQFAIIDNNLFLQELVSDEWTNLTALTAQTNVNTGDETTEGLTTKLDGVFAPLVNDKIPVEYIPVFNIAVYPVSSEVEMLALDAKVGDIAIRSDESKTYILKALPATLLANWIELLFVTGVTSINGQTGDLTIDKTFVGLPNVVNKDTSTTSNITDSTDKRFITDAQKTVLSNTSNSNTGDQDLSGLVPKTTTINSKALSGNITLTKTDISLGNVVNADTTTTANITDSLNKRFVTDANLTVLSNTSNTNTGDETQATIFAKITYTPENAANKAINLTTPNDTEYPTTAAVSTGLGLKQDNIVATSSLDYYRGDKTMAVLNKAAVGLPNVDNTSDANKPISTLTQNALNTKMNRLTSTYTVGDASADFLTIQAAVTWLSTGGNMIGNTSLQLGAGVHNITDTVVINLPYTLLITGAAFDITIINAATGLFNKPMFSIYSACNFVKFRAYATTLADYGNLATENFVNILTNDLYCEFKDFGAYGFYDGVLNVSNSELWFNDYEILNSKHDAIAMNSSSAGAKITSNLGVFSGNANACFNLIKGSGASLLAMSSVITLTASQKGVLYDGANFVNYDVLSVSGTTWNRTGTLFSGFDFTRTDGRDANIELLSNVGVEDKIPHCHLKVLNNTATTTVTTGGTFYKANITAGTQSFYTCKAKVETNRVTYLPLAGRDGWIHISGNVLCNNLNRNVDIAIVKNGNPALIFGQMTVRVTTANQPFAISTNAYIEDLANNNYFEIWVTSTNNGDVVTVQDLNCLFLS